MKRVYISLIFIFLSIFIFGESIKIDTSYGKKTLIIPDTYTELRKAYIDMAKLYVEERYAHEKSLTKIKELLNITDDLKLKINKLRKLNSEMFNIIEDLKKPDIFQVFINGGINYNVLNFGLYPQLGVNINFNENYSFNLLYQFPTSIALLFGWRVY